MRGLFLPLFSDAKRCIFRQCVFVNVLQMGVESFVQMGGDVIGHEGGHDEC